MQTIDATDLINSDWIKFTPEHESEVRVAHNVGKSFKDIPPVKNVKTFNPFLKAFVKTLKGGPGSGNHGHAGRPGKVGGSAPSKGGAGKSLDLYGLNGNYQGYIDYYSPGLPPVRKQGIQDEEFFAQYREYRSVLRKRVNEILDKNGLTLTTADFRAEESKYLEEFSKGKGDEKWLTPEVDAIMEIEKMFRHEYEFRVKAAISRGDIEVEEGARLAGTEAEHPNYADWKLLPEESYHATVNSKAVQAQGLKSRKERGISGGEGLGGGEDETISLTDRQDYARTIERGLHEMSLAARGTLTVRKMFELAEQGAGGVGHDWSSRLGTFTKSIIGIDDRDKLIEIDEGKGIKHEWSVFNSIPDRPYTQDEIMGNRMQILKSYMAARSDQGGFENPMFMFNDWKKTAALDPAQFKVHVYKPANPRAKGTYLGPAEGEYRIVGGDAVKFVKAIDFFGPDDLDEIFGVPK